MADGWCDMQSTPSSCRFNSSTNENLQRNRCLLQVCIRGGLQVCPCLFGGAWVVSWGVGHGWWMLMNIEPEPCFVGSAHASVQLPRFPLEDLSPGRFLFFSEDTVVPACWYSLSWWLRDSRDYGTIESLWVMHLGIHVSFREVYIIVYTIHIYFTAVLE